MKNFITKIKDKEYSQTPFTIMLMFISFLQGIIFYLNAEEWDYGQHNNVARYLFVHEIKWDSFQKAKHAVVYPMYHVLVKLIHLMGKLDYHMAVALLMLAFSVWAIYCFRSLIQTLSQKKNSYLVDILSIFSIVFIAARGPLTHWRYYIIMTGPNPIHNPTFILVRPFAIICFCYFCKFFYTFEKSKKTELGSLIGFGAFAFLSVIAKPSFAVTFLPAMGLYTLYVMVNKKDLMVGIKTLIAVLPTVCMLFFQRHFMASESTMLGIDVHFGSFMDLSVIDVIMVTVAFAPAALLLINVNNIKNNVYYKIALLSYIIGWLQFYFLDNGNSGDFSWGYALSIEILVVVSLALSLRTDLQYKYGKIRIPLAWLCFAYQMFMGLLYLYKVYKFGDYWI